MNFPELIATILTTGGLAGAVSIAIQQRARAKAAEADAALEKERRLRIEAETDKSHAENTGRHATMVADALGYARKDLEQAKSLYDSMAARERTCRESMELMEREHRDRVSALEQRQAECDKGHSECKSALGALQRDVTDLRRVIATGGRV